MEKGNIDKFKSLVSNEKSGWLEKANWRQDNQEWLDISFSIAVKMLSTLRSNKKAGFFPKNQKELARAMNCSPQYINKLLKGKEKINIETIVKIQNALDISILSIDKSVSMKSVANAGAQFSRVKLKPKNYSKEGNLIKANFKVEQEIYSSKPRTAN